MITDQIQSEIKEAMKARDEVRLSTLRMLLSELKNERIDLQHDLTAEEGLGVIRKEVKKRKDAIEAFTKAGNAEMASREEAEMKILQAYLPAELTDSEIEALVESTISELGITSMQEMGRVIGAVMAKTEGRADGSKVSSLVKAKLS